MIVLTDTRQWADEVLAAFAPVAAEDRGPHLAGPAHLEAWHPVAVDSLSEAERDLWRAVGSGDAVLRCRLEVVAELAAWDYLVLVDEAGGSQFDALRRLDPATIPGSVACVAAAGSGFHGHHDRTWQTLRGNLHLSTFCDPRLPSSSCGLAMTTLPAVAVLDALDRCGPWRTRPGIKWVNDILVESRKTAGVLTATQSLRGELNSLTFGIGLNVGVAPAAPPSPCSSGTGCTDALFAGTGNPPELGRLLREILQAISRRLRSVAEVGPTPLIDAYRSRNVIIGRRVAIWPDQKADDGSGSVSREPMALGTVRAIGPDLALTLEGHPDPIRCGRLALVDEPGTA